MNMNTIVKENKAEAIGAIVVALIVLFTLYNLIPWETKVSVAQIQASFEQRVMQVDKRLDRIENSVEDIRRYLLGPRRDDRP